MVVRGDGNFLSDTGCIYHGRGEGMELTYSLSKEIQGPVGRANRTGEKGERTDITGLLLE